MHVTRHNQNTSSICVSLKWKNLDRWIAELWKSPSLICLDTPVSNMLPTFYLHQYPYLHLPLYWMMMIKSLLYKLELEFDLESGPVPESDLAIKLEQKILFKFDVEPKYEKPPNHCYCFSRSIYGGIVWSPTISIRHNCLPKFSLLQ